MQALNKTAAAALRELLAAQPLSPAKVCFAWRVAAGPALARATTPSWTPDGRLVIRTVDPWRAEVVRARGLLLERLRGLLGSGAVTSIVVTS